MTNLQDLYQSIILDHNRRPQNYGELPDATAVAAGRNPLCGDEVNVALRLAGDVVEEVRFTAQGCAVSRASASIMTTIVKGRTRDEVEELFTTFHDLVTGKSVEGISPTSRMAVFSGVSRFPMRVKCASMAWHTLKQALDSPVPPPSLDAPTSGGERLPQ